MANGGSCSMFILCAMCSFAHGLTCHSVGHVHTGIGLDGLVVARVVERSSAGGWARECSGCPRNVDWSRT